MTIVIHALMLYFIAEFARALPWVAKAMEQGKKPWACNACLATWIGIVTLPLLYGRCGVLGVPWKLWLATLGVTHLILRVSWALKAVAHREEWVLEPGRTGGEVDQSGPKAG